MPTAVRCQIVRQLRETTKLPSTAEAWRIARETDLLVADRTRKYRSGLSDDERKALTEDLDAMRAVTRAVLSLAHARLTPLELASRLENWHCPGIWAKSPVTLDWLHCFEEPVSFPCHFLGPRRRWDPPLVPYRSSAPWTQTKSVFPKSWPLSKLHGTEFRVKKRTSGRTVSGGDPRRR